MRSEKNHAGRRAEIRSFLMARRAAIAPESVGLPGGSRRRTPGLRREELAALAGIGVTWYTWFEQGRDIRVSAAALERISAALQLSPSDSEYLFSLCGIPRREFPGGEAEDMDTHAQDVLDAIQGAPAFMGDMVGDVFAFNQLGDLVFDFHGCEGAFRTNHHWRFFLDARRRERYLDWERLAELYVPWLRLAYGKASGDARFERLIQELYAGSGVFRRLWDTQTTAPLLDRVTFGMKVPQIGQVHFNSARFTSSNSRLLLAILTPADEATARAMSDLSAKLPSFAGRGPDRRQAGGS